MFTAWHKLVTSPHLVLTDRDVDFLTEEEEEIVSLRL